MWIKAGCVLINTNQISTLYIEGNSEAYNLCARLVNGHNVYLVVDWGRGINLIFDDLSHALASGASFWDAYEVESKVEEQLKDTEE